MFMLSDIGSLLNVTSMHKIDTYCRCYCSDLACSYKIPDLAYTSVNPLQACSYVTCLNNLYPKQMGGEGSNMNVRAVIMVLV